MEAEPHFNIRHGHARKGRKSPTYLSWKTMRARCSNPNLKDWKYYGGRGVTVCKRWCWFDNFLADMGERPPGLTLERVDNDKGYEPDNCKWATRSEQQSNRRKPQRRI